MIRRYGDHLTNQRPVSDSPRDQSGGQLDRDVCCVLELMLAPALLHGLEFPNNNSTIGQQQQSGSLRLGLIIKTRGKNHALVYWLVDSQQVKSIANFNVKRSSGRGSRGNTSIEVKILKIKTILF